MIEKPKIYFVINDFKIGGVQRQFLKQSRHFNHDAFNYGLITLFRSDNQINLYDSLDSRIDSHVLNFNNFYDIKEWKNLYKLFKKIRPNIVVSSLFFSNTIVRILKIFCGYVVIAREHNIYDEKSTSEIIIDKILSYITYRIVAVSLLVRDFTSRVERIPKSKFIVIPNGIELHALRNGILNNESNSEFKDALLNNLNIQGRKIILSVGRLAPQKNHDRLIEAFARFHSSYSEYVLLIVGEGQERKKLENLIKKFKLNNTCFLVGEQKLIDKYYYAADFYVSTSRIEGFSNSALEALACGLPVALTDTGGTIELLQENVNGYLIPERKIEVICETLIKMTTFNTDKEHKLNISHTVDMYSIENTVTLYEKLFRETLEGTGR